MRLIAALWLLASAYVAPAAVQVEPFRLQSPTGASVKQASDLCYGQAGGRTGLWVVCDRNGEESAAKIYLVSARTLASVRGDTIRADEEFVIVPPSGTWEDFTRRNAGAGPDVLEDCRRRLLPAEERGDEPFFDLEAVTIAPAATEPHEPRLWVATEEPFSTILELSLRPLDTNARLEAVYAYREDPRTQGTARNDGIEGLAWSGRPGEFFFAEEGTRDPQGRPSALLFFLDPVLGLGRLKGSEFAVDTETTVQLTEVVRACRQSSAQTLNALARSPDGALLAVDRNGGWILRVTGAALSGAVPHGSNYSASSPAATGALRAERWLNLYDLQGVNLRERLADFPGPRRMPYISIEGIAVEPGGDLWLCDDPAIPEGWRESCLIRLRIAPTASGRVGTQPALP